MSVRIEMGAPYATDVDGAVSINVAARVRLGSLIVPTIGRAPVTRRDVLASLCGGRDVIMRAAAIAQGAAYGQARVIAERAGGVP